MTIISKLALCGATATVITMAGFAPQPSLAADTEVFFTTSVDSSARPNVLFILDTSQSMYKLENSPPATAYSAAVAVSGDCDTTAYYWSTRGDGTPDCNNTAATAALTDDQFACDRFQAEVDSNGLATREPLRVAQRVGNRWVTLARPQQSEIITCQSDVDSAELLSAGLSEPNWTATGNRRIDAGAYTIYSGNYINWLNTGGGEKYRIDVVREVVGRLVASTSGVKIGLMRYGYDGSRVFRQNTATACEVEPNPVEDSRSSNGAPIVFPVTDLDSPTPVPQLPGATVREQLFYQLGVDAANQEVISWVVDPSVADDQQPFQIARGGGNTCPIPLFTPGGRSPIGGAMYEAYLYYSGSQWSLKFGQQADLGSTFSYPSVPQSRIDGFNGGERYQSPIMDECAKNYIILLSDGTTEQDNDIDGPISRLPGFEEATGRRSCDPDEYLDALRTPPPSQCVDDMAELMYESDMSPTEEGLNNVITYTVGFRLDDNDAATENAARELLRETASRGGGEFYEAADAQRLEEILTDVLRQVLTDNTSFSAPAVTVNAFNRTQNLNELYLSLFRPDFQYRWLGNVKKYQIDPIDGDILDANGDAAVDPGTGFFRDGARSFWSMATDGSDIAVGGAASRIDPGSRRVYTNFTGTANVSLSATANSVSQLRTMAAADANAYLDIQPTDYLAQGVSASGALSASHLVDWLYNRDVGDVDGDGNRTEGREDMGDPLHSRPQTLIYGGTPAAPDLDDAVVFILTNDGSLQSIDVTTGEELWSFIPANLLDRARELYYDESTEPEDRVYGLDGNIRVLRIDKNRNGIIEPDGSDGPDADSAPDPDSEDSVILYFGQRRGGSYYYAVDVTRKEEPRLLWARSYSAYGAGQSWSTPVPMQIRVNAGTAVSPLYVTKPALAIGGGYDVQEDATGWIEAATVGNRVLIVDALNGDLIWQAGLGATRRNASEGLLNESQSPTLVYMDKPIPGDVRVIDLTGDGLADRMYVGDLHGQVFRFDINSGAVPDSLVSGGLFAKLGLTLASPVADQEYVDNRKFFYSPDASLITTVGPTFLNIAIGSGHREAPIRDTTVDNYFYSLRDYNVFGALPNDAYRATCGASTGPCHEIINHDSLLDVTATAIPDSAVVTASTTKGWKMGLTGPGEKALAESRTFQNAVYFTTYEPRNSQATPDDDLVCAPRIGVNRLYVLRVADAGAAINLDIFTEGLERSKELSQGSIAPEVVFVFPTPPPNPNNPNAPVPAVPPVCLVGVENCGSGILNPPVRTYWRQRGAD